MLGNIQALRAFAAYLVVLVHLDPLTPAYGFADAFGGTGVDLFFVISGFIMVHATSRAPTSPSAFFANRIARIVPLYWLSTIAVFALAAMAPSLMGATRADPIELVKSLLFVPFAKSNGLVQPVLFVGWTLNYEMFFYAIFALSLLSGSLRLRVLLASFVLAALVVAGTLWPPDNPISRFYTDPILMEFVLGMAVGALHVRRTFKGVPRLAAIAGLALGVTALAAAPSLALPGSRVVGSGLPALLIVASALALEDGGWRVTLPFMILLGDASYAIYLTHPYVTQAVVKLAARLDAASAISVCAFVVLAYAAVTAVGVLIHRFVEKPLSTMARTSLGARRQAVPARGP